MIISSPVQTDAITVPESKTTMQSRPQAKCTGRIAQATNNTTKGNNEEMCIECKNNMYEMKYIYSAISGFGEYPFITLLT